MKCPYCDYESRVVSEFCVNCRHKLDVDNNKENIKGQLNAYKWYSPRKKHLRNGLSNASKLTRASIQEEKPLYKVWVQNSNKITYSNPTCSFNVSIDVPMSNLVNLNIRQSTTLE